mmetsp:Transcript_28553/g.69201  ORF Transcript_28553/g.69201 Transcript_28553/m.69201 type:complete len:173 (+) Transcript_28553:238-756(+)|eukprot:CAMPEP_0113627870 /NCGR_PEP_ID=MMETSP0017_2-20120614/14437_1 /TAXON_ID=2856 /ORGANISM="Cylindrotheca closterium" /LENGTH=172 /DNA_ID=CAMNT_0000538147 /DNA_START=210 /DNA_END=728 /DNA_ORIENTATION=+ /assembly_acc=CAM_ASM_000147
MRLPQSRGNSYVPNTPVTPKCFASPGAGDSASKSSAWQEKLKLRNKVKRWSQKLPMDDDEPTKSGSQRSFFQDIDTTTEALWGSQASIEYIDDEDDVAASFYCSSPSTFLEDDDDDDDDDNKEAQPSQRPEEVTSPLSSPLTQSKRSGMRKHMKKQLSGYNFAALLLAEEEV